MESSHLLEPLAWIGIAGLVIAAALFDWFRMRSYRRRIRDYHQSLRAVGFESSDLESAETINRKWAQIIQAKLPSSIEFTSVDSHEWKDEAKYRKCEKELVAQGFRRIGLFAATPQRWLAEFWVSESLDGVGVVPDSSLHGPYLDLMTWYVDGTHASFSNCQDSGLCEADGQHIYCGYIDPTDLIVRWLRDRPAKEAKKPTRETAVALYEQTTNEHLATHHRDGISEDAIRRYLEFRSRIKKGRS